jgi:hypothetical protein
MVAISNLSHGHFVIVGASVAAADEPDPQLEISFAPERGHELGVGDPEGPEHSEERLPRGFQTRKEDIAVGLGYETKIASKSGLKAAQHISDRVRFLLLEVVPGWNGG